MTLEKVFGKNAQLIVLENLLDKGTNYLSGIAEDTGLSTSSVSRVIEPLLSSGIVTEERLGKHIRIFKLDYDSNLTKLVIKFYKDSKGLLKG
ncbi:MAG: MarR family transcriptional regulator [Halobacteriota archaeon]|nr:MarR family transcriptional regulator [Halobacteriota archaeon]